MSAVLDQKIPLNELAKRWGWKPSRLYRLCRAKRIPHVRIGRDIFFEVATLEQWMERQRRYDVAAPTTEIKRARTYAEECERAGVDVNHRFA